MSWRDLFGHSQPYPAQRDGIEAAVDSTADGGRTTADALASQARSQQAGDADSGHSGPEYLAIPGEPTLYRPDTEVAQPPAQSAHIGAPRR